MANRHHFGDIAAGEAVPSHEHRLALARWRSRLDLKSRSFSGDASNI
jgi:hypothetical protein